MAEPVDIAPRLTIEQQRKPFPLCTIDSRGLITGVSTALTSRTGFDNDEFLGKNVTEFLTEEFKDPDRFRQIYQNAVATIRSRGNGTQSQSEPIVEIKLPDGTIRSVMFMPELDTRPRGSSRHTELQFTLTDVTELAIEAATDPLTGLPNRRNALSRINDLESLEKHIGRPSIFGLSDFDYFKRVNDTYGYAAGDTALKEVAKRIHALFRRSSEIVARYGGDEFLEYLPETNITNALSLGEIIRTGIASRPVAVRDHTIHMTTSIGLAIRSATEIKISPSQMIDRADAAIKAAKKCGKNAVGIYFPTDEKTGIIAVYLHEDNDKTHMSVTLFTAEVSGDITPTIHQKEGLFRFQINAEGVISAQNQTGQTILEYNGDEQVDILTNARDVAMRADPWVPTLISYLQQQASSIR